MRKKIFCIQSFYAAVVAVVIFSISTPSAAGVNQDWDWVSKKRTLKVWVNVAADTKLGDVRVSDAVSAAITEINGANSGWKLESGSSSDHDIEIRLQDIDEDIGGAQNEFSKISRARQVSKRTISIDPTPKGGETWGSSGKTFDPQTVITHELIHKLRIKHQSGSSDTVNIADPSTPGNHQHSLSSDDKTDLTASATAETQRAQQSAGPSNPSPNSFTFDAKNGLLFQAGMFSTNADIGFSLTSDFESIINPFKVFGMDDYRIVTGFLIDITGASPAQADGRAHFHIGYRDNGFDIADPQYLPVEESSLSPFLYDIASEKWIPFELFNLHRDMALNQVVFDADVDNLLHTSNAGFDISSPTSIFTFVALGGRELPEPNELFLAGLALFALVGVRSKGPRSN